MIFLNIHVLVHYCILKELQECQYLFIYFFLKKIVNNRFTLNYNHTLRYMYQNYNVNISK